MGTQALSKLSERMPSVFDEFIRPWNEWFDNRGLTGRMSNVPAVNITEQKDEYLVSLAAPGLKKDDFKITLDGNMITTF
jgi:HSP20 family protein